MKTICIYHRVDLDGWMSAAIVKKWFEEDNEGKNSIPSIINYTEKDNVCRAIDGISLDMLGWHYGDEIPDLSEYDKVIMCDVSFPAMIMQEVHDKFGENFIWIDHHIGAMKSWDVTNNPEITVKPFVMGLRDVEFAACELTWKYFMQGMSGDPDKESSENQMPEIVRLLGRYDCFGHKGTDEERDVLEFQYGARQAISSYEDAYRYLLDSFNACESDMLDMINTSGQTIYQYLCTEAKQIYQKTFPIIFEFNTTPKGAWTSGDKPKLTQGKIKYRFLCVNRERFNPVNFGIDYHKENYAGFACFWHVGGKWQFSLYNDNGEVDCSEIAKQYGGGGHKGAAGFIVEDLKQIF